MNNIEKYQQESKYGINIIFDALIQNAFNEELIK